MKRFVTALFALLLLSGCAQVQLASHVAKKAFPPEKTVAAAPTPTQGSFKVGNPYKIRGKTYYPQESYNHTETGIASWYGPGFHGKMTANGEIFNENELTAAHRTLQMPSLVRVTNLENGKSLIVRVNDRGPFARGRVIDLSKRAAELLDMKVAGTAKVKIELLPQESQKIAAIAQSGQSTRGYEVALNQGRKLPPAARPDGSYKLASNSFQHPGTPAPPPSAAISREELAAPAITGQTRNGAFYPDPVVSERAVSASNIYIQAGSFTVYDNAQQLSRSLSRFAQTEVQPALIGGTQYYRVRLGPIARVDQADRLLASVVAEGNNGAVIVVD